MGQELQGGIGTVRALLVVHEPNAQLPLAPLEQVLEGADPGHPIPAPRAVEPHVPEADEEPSVGKGQDLVPVTGKGAREGTRASRNLDRPPRHG